MVKLTKSSDGFSVSEWEGENQTSQAIFPEFIDAVDYMAELGGEVSEAMRRLMDRFKVNCALNKTILDRLETLALAM